MYLSQNVLFSVLFLKTLGSLQRLSTALNILEKYGCNLTNPNRPKYWRTVKHNNPVFRATVDAIQVNIHIHIHSIILLGLSMDTKHAPNPCTSSTPLDGPNAVLLLFDMGQIISLFIRMQYIHRCI